MSRSRNGWEGGSNTHATRVESSVIRHQADDLETQVFVVADLRRSGGGTFDLTALALLDGWPLKVVVVDMVWGTVLTAGTAGVSLWLTRAVLRPNG